MSHKDNLNYLQLLKKQLGDDPAAGKVATIINEYESVINSRLEHKFLEVGKKYQFNLITEQFIEATILEVGTYAIEVQTESGGLLLFKASIAFVRPTG